MRNIGSQLSSIDCLLPFSLHVAHFATRILRGRGGGGEERGLPHGHEQGPVQYFGRISGYRARITGSAALG